MKSIKQCKNKIMFLTVMAGISLSPFAKANKAEKKHHKEASHKAGHGAHVHGAAKLSIALENDRNGTLLLESPGDSIVGFEHTASSKLDKATEKTALAMLKENGATLFVFDPAKKCSLQNTRVEIKKEEHHEDGDDDDHDKEDEHGEHNEVEAEYKVLCQESLSNSQFKIELGNKFPRIKNLEVQILGDKIQKSEKLKGAVGSVSF